MDFHTLGAYYQCHKNPTSFLRTIKSFQTHYPENYIHVINDGGYDYSEFCMTRGIKYTYFEKSNNSRGAHCFSNRRSAIEFLLKLWNFINFIPATHFILLEDDVRVLRHHTVPFYYSINGCNFNEFLPPSMQKILTENGYSGKFFYGAYGGTVLFTSFFKGIEFPSIIQLLNKLPDVFECDYGSDMLLSCITLYFGGTIGDHPEIAETWYKNINTLINENKVSFLHQFKSDYDSYGEKMSPYEKKELMWNIN